MQDKRKNNGGSRQGAGAKPKYKSEMCNLVMWIPLIHKEEIRKEFREVLKKYYVE